MKTLNKIILTGLTSFCIGNVAGQKADKVNYEYQPDSVEYFLKNPEKKPDFIKLEISYEGTTKLCHYSNKLSGVKKLFEFHEDGTIIIRKKILGPVLPPIY